MPTFTDYPAGGSPQPADLFIVYRPGVGTVTVTGNSIAVNVLPAYAAAPAAPTPGTAYFDTSLGYPRVYGSDAQWHGFLLS